MSVPLGFYWFSVACNYKDLGMFFNLSSAILLLSPCSGLMCVFLVAILLASWSYEFSSLKVSFGRLEA